MLGNISGCHNWGWDEVGEKLLASSGWRPGIRLNLPRRSGWPPATKNDLAPNVSSAEAEKPRSGAVAKATKYVC